MKILKTANYKKTHRYAGLLHTNITLTNGRQVDVQIPYEIDKGDPGDRFTPPSPATPDFGPITDMSGNEIPDELINDEEFNRLIDEALAEESEKLQGEEDWYYDHKMDAQRIGEY